MAYVQRRKTGKGCCILALFDVPDTALIKSFDTKIRAKKWARGIERKLDKGDFSDYTEAS